MEAKEEMTGAAEEQARNGPVTAVWHRKKKLPPWNWPPVHPEAEKLPMMSDAEIKELSADILENGLQEPVHIWVDNHAAVNGSEGPFPEQLMDGRNRREALRLLNHNSPLEVNTAGVRYHNAIKRRSKNSKNWVPDCDPVKFILSANVHRRHLTAEQRREAINRFLKADPMASNRAVAKTLGVSHHTVTIVRNEAVRDGHIAQSERPIERAIQALRANPSASVTEIAKNAKVGRATVQKARKLVAEGPTIAPPTAQDKATPQPEKPALVSAPQEKGTRIVRRYLTKAYQCARRIDLSDDEIMAMLRAIVDEHSARNNGSTE